MMHLRSLCLVLWASAALASGVYVDMWATQNCSGAPNRTVLLSERSENNCAQCWDRCAAGVDGYRSLRLRRDGKGGGGAAVSAALNANCIGKYSYAGGWSDATLGGVVSTSSGCHNGGLSAIVLCTGRADGMQDDLLEVCGAATPPPPEPVPSPAPFAVLDAADFAHRFGADADGRRSFEWAERHVPFVDLGGVAGADALLQAYYYRWHVFRRHLKWTGADGWVVTEFLPYVSWSGRHNTIPAAAGHHIAEGTWLLDQRPIDDYIRFWYGVSAYANASSGGDPTTYTSWIAHAAWRRSLVTGNETVLLAIRDAAAATFRDRFVPAHVREAAGTKCWSQSDGSDAMEVSVSGDGCRPTIASAMFAEAAALAEMAQLPPAQGKVVDEFVSWANMSRRAVLDLHWNPRIDSFAVVPLQEQEQEQEQGQGQGQGQGPRIAPPAAVTRSTSVGTPGSGMPAACNLSAVRTVNRTVEVRELLGFIPWYFASEDSYSVASKAGALLPLGSVAGDRGYGQMWGQLFDDAGGMAAPWGLRTVERRTPCYNYSYEHGDCWNGPSWPYETARILTGAANALNMDLPPPGSPPGLGALNASSYWSLLLQYARQHTLSHAVNDTAVPPGSGHVFENLHADLGYWNNRQRMYWDGADTRNMGNHYMHSSFADVVITGLMGLRPQRGATVVVNPLVPPGTTHFALDHVRYKGAMLAIVYDVDGSHYGARFGKGLSVLVDGKVVARSTNLSRLVVNITTTNY